MRWIVKAVTGLRSRRSPRRRFSREDGQSAMEFALMLPFIFLAVFFIVQMSIVYSMAHQGSLASYAAARFHRVVPPELHSEEAEEDVARSILSGSFWDMVEPTWTHGDRDDGGELRISWRELNTRLPYQPKLAGCKQIDPETTQCQEWASWSIPTHLGPNVWEHATEGEHPIRGARETGRRWTDNNIMDDAQ